MVKKLNLNAIRIDGGTQSRVEINNEAVSDYAEAVKVGIEFPPIVVFYDGADHWLADGFHRYHSHKQAGKASILADVREGTLLDAKLFALGANGTHGLRRSNADKRKAVQMAFDEPSWAEWSDRKIAEVCGVSNPFVSGMRKPAQVLTVNTPAPKKAGAEVLTVNTQQAPDSNTESLKSPAAKAEDFGPSEEEIAAAQRDQEEELASLRRIADSDDKLKAAMDEARRFREENRILKERINSLMNEKLAAVRAAKSWQRKAEAATA